MRAARNATERVRSKVARGLSPRCTAGERLLVAVSGGVDSTCLAHALVGLAAEHGFEVAIGHVHHGLRGSEADADETAVAHLAAALGVRFQSERVDPRALRSGRSSRDRPTLQEAARTVRYDALRRMAAAWAASAIATAHTADDQTETVLLRLLRGAGPDGLAGIPSVADAGRLLRPLLAVDRRELLAYASENALAWREDPSNASSEYARNRLRQQWIPGLAKEFNPRLNEAVRRLVEAQERDRAWLEGLVGEEAARRFHSGDGEGGGFWIDGEAWGALPEGLALRLARRAMRDLGVGREVTTAHLKRLSAFLGAQTAGAELELPGGLRVRRWGPRGHLYRVERNRPC